MPRPRIPERRERLLAAARELALERGWPATAVSDIAERVGVGKGAVYLEFPTKAAILDALIEQGLRGLSADVRGRVVAAEDVLDLPTIYRFAVEALLADPLMRALFLGGDDVLGEHARAVDDDRYRQRFDWLADYIAELQGAGVIDPAVDRPALVRMFSVFTIGLVHAPGTLAGTTDDELRSTVGVFADLVGRGLAGERPVDQEGARRAQLTLIERLDAQLGPSEEH